MFLLVLGYVSDDLGISCLCLFNAAWIFLNVFMIFGGVFNAFSCGVWIIYQCIYIIPGWFGDHFGMILASVLIYFGTFFVSGTSEAAGGGYEKHT